MENKITRIQIHKNNFREYYDQRWEDVPEFLLFDTVPEGWIQVWEVEKKPRRGQLARAKMEKSP